MPKSLRFSGNIRPTALSVDKQIVESDALILPDGFDVRWIGGVDVLLLRDIAQVPVCSEALIAFLERQHLKRQEAISLIFWCLGNGVLVGQ